MADQNVTRKLVAILFVDVVGYSRLMGKDEQGTIARQKAHREELIEPKISEHHGRIVRAMGDGLLLEFPSVVEAFQCAIQLQNGMAERNMEIPDDRKMLLRIGLNVGDVVVDGGDILGDGVNVAARLQEISYAGGVTVSATAYEHLVDKFSITLEDAGVRKFKNITRPIRIWRWPAVDRLCPETKNCHILRAYDYFLVGREHYWLLSRSENAYAKDLLKRALELNPDLAPAHAYFAEALVLDYVNQWSKEVERLLENAYALAQRAVTLDETSAPAHSTLGSVSLWRRQHDEAMLEHQKALILDPDYADGHMGRARVLHYAGRPEQAIGSIEQAMQLNPYYPAYYLHVLAQIQFQLGRYEEASASLTRRITRDPKTDISRVLLASSYGHLHRVAEARFEWSEALRVNPRYSLEHRKQILPYRNRRDLNNFVQGLCKADLPPPPYTPRRGDY
jgi:class 3 adenylate cyclase/cytochrome c-type biogenesis protein CcmH/NrfG